MRSFILAVCTVSACCVFSCRGAASEDRIELSGQTMGTYYRVVIADPAKADDIEQIRGAIEDRLMELNRQMSTWDASSEISQFNQAEAGLWISISPEFGRVFREARRIHGICECAFDPTVGPLVDLWGFGSTRPKAPPSEQEIQEAMNRVGMNKIELRESPPALRKTVNGVQLNLSAIAKGYAVDDLLQTVQRMGIKACLVDIGGETRAGDLKPSGEQWTLGIESPIGGLQKVVPLTNASLATSGDYRNFFEKDGRRYSHAIDPSTGYPVEDPPAAVSVLHDSCMTADAFATGLMILKEQRGIEIAKQHNLTVLFQRITPQKTVSLIQAGSFPERASADSGSNPRTTRTKSPPSSSGTSGQNWWIPFVAAAAIFLFAVGAMSLGTMLQNRQIKGSCGGLASLPGHDGKSACDLCSIPKDQCSNNDVRRRLKEAAATSDASPVSVETGESSAT